MSDIKLPPEVEDELEDLVDYHYEDGFAMDRAEALETVHAAARIGLAAGVAQERERVVAWLRSGCRGHVFGGREVDERGWGNVLADAIESAVEGDGG